MGNGNDFRSDVLKQMTAAACAGMLADSLVYPLMTVKSRLMVGGSYKYNGPFDALTTIARQEGWRTLYKGYASVVQVAPSQALYMSTYQTIKAIVPGGQENPVVHFCGGLFATLVQSLVSVPLEVVRQRQMVHTAGQPAYKGSLDAARTIYAQEGLGALYRGFLLAQMVWGPYNAIYLPLWERTKMLAVRYTGVESKEQLGMHWELSSSFLSASVASACTNPMDVVKTRLQVQGKSKQYKGTLDAAQKIWKKEGIKGFTSGMSSRILWVGTSCMVMFTAYDQFMKRL
ncbi:mitochondrial substrate carrier family protein E-like [Selaginella moellendorffii]|uniref:mitochondrial substrate carrier family protein E-like n=1 Tax=Selaginella moellendorffii TaxID=88036 RepID=UPI000D1C4049|nr:mitochondrial substrate carrier family protein E-like [Selaginella moellendorffii]|eukprot:XP_024543461.1 mitochondrial substrate carrier family protein E-like [Selaginella moellendorffii]